MIIDTAIATKRLKAGDVVAIPTDTVYGLAASIHSQSAIERLFTLKGRPASNPMVIQIASYTEILPFIKGSIPRLEDLANKFWPGALTLVVPVHQEKIPSIIRASLPSCGFRVPQQKQVIKLLQVCGPLVVPSANLSSQEPALSPDQVNEIFGNDFPVLDGGVCESSIPSTVLSYEGNGWRIIRQGAVNQSVMTNFLESDLLL